MLQNPEDWEVLVWSLDTLQRRTSSSVRKHSLSSAPPGALGLPFPLSGTTRPIFLGFSARRPLNQGPSRGFYPGPSWLTLHVLLANYPLPHCLTNMLMGLGPLSSADPLQSCAPTWPASCWFQPLSRCKSVPPGQDNSPSSVPEVSRMLPSGSQSSSRNQADIASLPLRLRIGPLIRSLASLSQSSFLKCIRVYISLVLPCPNPSTASCCPWIKSELPDLC